MSLGFTTGGLLFKSIKIRVQACSPPKSSEETFHCRWHHSHSCLTRIAHGNSPEEVARWREERRSKFPTKAVVEEKMARQKELRERGEVGLNYLEQFLLSIWKRWLV